MSSSNLVVSGERFSLGKSSQRNQEDHVARYEFACTYVVGKKVLDIACGTGYGAKLLKDAGADEVVGVDIDVETINHAVENFSEPGINFICESASKVALPSESFDVIVSFETIEHLDDEIRFKYLANLHSCLKKNGLLILSTPNKLVTSPWSKKPLNPYHVLEYYKQDLEAELSEANFSVVSWLGQRFVKSIFTKRISYLFIRLAEKITRKDFGIYTHADSAAVKPILDTSQPRYFVVVAQKK